MRIKNSDIWISDIQSKAIENNRDFDKQLLLDVLYVLEVVDKNITFKESEYLKTKYNLI